MERRHRREAGTVLVEAAFTLLTLLIFLFGIMEAGRFFQVQETLTNAAREGARVAVAPLTQTTTLASCGSGGPIQTAVQNYLSGASITNATISCDTIRYSDGAVVGTYPAACTEPCGSRVTVSAPYQIMTISMFSNLSMTLKGKALMRNETSP